MFIGRSGELLQESHVRLVEQPDVRDAVAEHGDPGRPHAEREARVPLGIVAHALEPEHLDVQRGDILADLARAGAPEGAFWAVVAALVLIGGLMLLALRFVLELSGIVRSVDRGDPFEPATAQRLQRMGWLTVGLYALGLLLGGIVAWIRTVAEGANPLEVDADFDFGGGGILLILTLFILARVFRHGAAMREELEGTV